MSKHETPNQPERNTSVNIPKAAALNILGIGMIAAEDALAPNVWQTTPNLPAVVAIAGAADVCMAAAANGNWSERRTRLVTTTASAIAAVIAVNLARHGGNPSDAVVAVESTMGAIIGGVTGRIIANASMEYDAVPAQDTAAHPPGFEQALSDEPAMPQDTGEGYFPPQPYRPPAE